MTTENIFTGIQSYIAGASGLPDVIFPNSSGEPSGDHLRVFILPASTSPIGISSGDLLTGVAQITIAVKDDTGTGEATRIADTLLTLFARNTEISQGGDLIRINQTGSVGPQIIGNGWFLLPVSIPYTVVK